MIMMIASAMSFEEVITTCKRVTHFTLRQFISTRKPGKIQMLTSVYNSFYLALV